MEATLSRSPGPEQSHQTLPHISPTIASADSATNVIQILPSPLGKRKFDVVKLEPNGDEAAATAKREKIGSGPLLKESDCCSEVDLIPTERELPPNVGSDVADPSKEEIKQFGRYTNGNRAPFPRFPSILSNFSDVDNKPSPAEPDFGAPDENAVRAVAPRPKPEMVIPGGPGRPASTYKIRDKTVGTGPDRPQQPSSPSKAFDLFADQPRQPSVERGTEQAAKRRKIMVARSPDEDIEDQLYEQTRNTTVSARLTKTVASGTPSLERKPPDQEYAVHEFKKVEATMHPTKPRRRPLDGRRSSTQSSRETTAMDEEDDIQGSDFEISKPPEPYKGTANRLPARTKEERDAKNNRHKPKGPGASVMGRGSLSMANGSGLVRARNINTVGGERATSLESISDDELSMGKPEPGPKKTNTGMMHLFTRSPTSGSMSREGDIRSSLPRHSQRKPMGRAGKSTSEDCPKFPIEYMRSARDIFTPIEGEERCYLQYNPKTSRMDVMMGDSNISEDRDFSSFTFSAASVKKMTYCTDNNKVVLSARESNAMTSSLPKLLVQLGNGATYKFVVFLQSKSDDAEVDDQNSDKLDRMFFQFTKKFEEFRRRSEVEELNLLKQRRNNRHQASEAGLTSYGKRPGNFDSSMEPPRTKKLHERFKGRSSDNETGSIELTKESGDTIQSRQFGPNGNDNDNRPTTRSTRGQNKEIHIRSPSPQRYTIKNPDWQRYWAGGEEPLVFPFEGKNKAQVDMRDIERLDEGEYLNDNLIAFYLRYLQEKSERERPDVFKRVFYLNTFFYPRLTKGKGRKNIDYDAVKRWTSKVNIFEYDYIVVPINENNHWYVAIICNVPKLILPPEERVSREEEQVNEKEVVDLGDAVDTASPAQYTASPAQSSPKLKEGSITPEVARKVSSLSIEDRASPEPQLNGAKHIDVERINPGTPNHTSTADDDTDRPQKAASSVTKGRKGKRKSIPPVRKYNIEEPRIITLDSLGVSHSPTCSNLRDFLIAEAKEKLGIDIILAQNSIGMTAKKIPEQNNHWDCGLFLLGYIEGFLDHPDETIHGIMQGNKDMASSFPKMNASDMRISMRELIFRLRREQTGKEHADKIARKAAKKAGKVNEVQPTGEPKSASSASTSPKPPVPPKLETKAAEESTSASETKEAPEPREEVVNVEEEQPKKEPSPSPEKFLSVHDFMDNLAGITPITTIQGEQPTEPSPRDTPPPIEESPKTAERRAISVETPSPKKGPTSSQFFKVSLKGQQQKYPSPDRSRRRKDAGEMAIEAPSTPPPRQARSQLRSSPRNSPRTQIDITSSSGSSEDSLRAGMSPSVLGRKTALKDADEIPDSQGDEGRNADKGKSVTDLTKTTPMTRAGEAALKRQKDSEEAALETQKDSGEAALKRQKGSAEVQKKKSGAGGVFGSPGGRKGKRKSVVEVLD
ncbi:hypothetical protein V494_01504 [Pseudogymnoascus sp. VKM F-4513 (FW-928)]|nr:hypothetical protein V494_01504 [Pseudogymnoascus sp. VKM F-4513 (FW-928)]